MSKALSHLNNVTFHLSIVKKMYTSLMKHIEWPKTPFRIMDIGCGSGKVCLEILEPLVPRHYHEIIGVDIDEEMIDVCRKSKKDSRISFEVMNIENEDIPSKFQNSFDFLFSSFALQYVRDLRMTLKNCKRLLKPGGELGFLFLYTTHPLYETYKRLYAIADWKPYTMDYGNYFPPLSSKNPLQDFKTKLNDEGLEVLWDDLNHDMHISEARNFLTLFTSVDSIYHKIPNEMKSKYEKDFAEALGDVMGFRAKGKDLEKTIEICFPTIMVRAKKRRMSMSD